MRMPSWITKPLFVVQLPRVDRRPTVAIRGSTRRAEELRRSPGPGDHAPFAVSERVERASSLVGEPRDQLVVVTAGEIDLATAPLLLRTLLDAVDRHPRVCCDLTGVTFFSAAGLAALVTAHHRAAGTDRHLSVRRAQGITRYLLDVSGVGQLLGTVPPPRSGRDDHHP
jgi:anti-anti-sigma factor